MIRFLARPMVASWFISEGVAAARNPESHVAPAQPLADQVTDALGRKRLTRRQLTIAVRVHGVLTAVAATKLALSRKPRKSALLLVALSAPLLVAQEPFSDSNPQRRARFLQTLSVTGGALLAGRGHSGRPSLGWRMKHARKKLPTPGN